MIPFHQRIRKSRLSGVRKRVEACDPPAPFKGLPITLIAAAITSLSFMGFGGIVENLFNVTL